MKKNLRVQIEIEPMSSVKNMALVSARYGNTLQNQSTTSCEWGMVESVVSSLVIRIQNTIALHELFNVKLKGVK